jgi:hypothetical protein
MFKTKAESTLHAWSSTERFDYVDGSHNGFERLSDPVTHRRRIVFVKPWFWLVVDALTAGARHQYDQYWHLGPEANVDQDQDLSVVALYDNQAGILIKPILTDGMSVQQHRASTDPIQGWVSYDYAVKVAAPTVQYSKTAKQSTTLATLLVPFKDKAPDVTVRAHSETQYEVVCDYATFVILLGDGTLQTIGEYEFDGDMLCAEFDLNGNLVDCSAAKASLIKYRGRTLLDSTVRHKIDSSNKMQ